MKVSLSSSWGKTLCTLLGGALAGPSGAVIGNLAGGLAQAVLPGAAEFIEELLDELTSDIIEKTGDSLAARLTPTEKQRINHDLQTAFRDAFAEGLYDLGGARCFPEVWQRRPRDVPEGLIYPLTPQANKLWREEDPRTQQICRCLRTLRDALAAGRLLPLNPPTAQPEADVNRYLQAETPRALADAFFTQIVEPHLQPFETLMAELPDFRRHLRRHLFDRTLVHLDEALKHRAPAWRAFNRLMLDGLRQELRAVGAGQTELAARLDALLTPGEGSDLHAWAEGMAELLSVTGRIETRVEEGFDVVLRRIGHQHREVLARFDRLTVVAGRLEAKMDRVLHILADGRYVVEGTPLVPLDTPPAPGAPPFKGLQHFETADADLFFGREQLTAKLVRHLQRHQALAVVGASGGGKSSVVRAGLIPALRRGEPLADDTLPPANSARWPVHLITPTAHPLDALAASLTRDAETVSATTVLRDDLARDSEALRLHTHKRLGQHAGERLLLVVDQFEELFTLCHDETERRAFVDNLMASVQDSGPVVLVLALRADFYAACAQFPALRQLLEAHQVFIGAMRTDELRAAIEGPAELGGWEFERGVVDLMLRDVGDAPGALPLLSHALLETWKHRRGRTMTLESYAESGGVRSAIARTAEAIYTQQLTPEEQTLARSIFLRLTALGEGIEETRRRASLSEIQPAAGPVLEILADARLITLSKEAVEIAHEALIREWPRLQQWLDENRAWLRVHRRLTEAAQEWRRFDCDEGLLYRGARLIEALESTESHGGALNPLEREFLTASQSLAERGAAEREAQRRRELDAARKLADAERQRAEVQAESAQRLRQRALYLTGALAAVVALLLTAVLTARYAFRQEQRAEQEAQVARARQLAAQSVAHIDDQPDLALLLASEAYQIHPNAQAEGSLLTVLSQDSRLAAFLRGHTADVNAVAVSPDGTTLASAGGDGTILLWDLAARQPLTAPLGGHLGLVADVAFSPDGQTLASAGNDGAILLWNVESQMRLAPPLTAHKSPIFHIAFSPDGRTLASADRDGVILLWDLATAQIHRRLTEHAWPISGLAFSPDGTRLASSDIFNQTLLWNPATGKPVNTALSGTDAVFSPDGSTLALSQPDHSILLWDLEREEPRGSALRGHTNGLLALAFTPNSRTLASAGWDRSIRLWDVTTGQQIALPLRGHKDAVLDLAFSPDGLRLISAAGEIVVWQLNTGPRLSRRLIGDATYVTDVAFSPNGQLIAASRRDMSDVALWDLTNTNPEPSLLTGHRDAVWSAAFSPDGETIATASADGTLRLWDTAARQQRETLLAIDVPLLSVAFSPRGDRIAAGDGAGRVHLWDVDAGELIAVTQQGDDTWIMTVAFSADGTLLASGALDGSIVVWDAATGERVHGPLRKIDSGEVHSVAFAPNGERLAAGYGDHTVSLWDLTTGALVNPPFQAHTGRVRSVAFSPDGRRLISGSADGTLTLWDVTSGQPIGPPLTGHSSIVSAVEFGPDGAEVISGDENGDVIVWNLDATSWQAQACALAHRNLTSEEWSTYLPETSYRQTCPDLPLTPYALAEAFARAESARLAGQNARAADIYTRTVRWALTSQSANVSNNVCWFGSVDGFADLVWPTCERAVALATDPYTAIYRDTRGLARALRGDTSGAIEDFGAYVAWVTQAHGEYAAQAERREAWIEALQAGENPFDEETLAALRDEMH